MKNFFLFTFAVFILVGKIFAQNTPSINRIAYGNNPKVGKYASIRGINLYYETYGQGKPLLLIHGNGGSIRDWRYQIPYFSKTYKVIAVDSRAQGKSQDSSDVLNYEMMADDFDALLTHLKIDSAYVIGWSDGGINGLLLAIRHPEKVKKLAITGANLVPGTSAISADGIKAISADLAKLRAANQDAATKNTIKLLHMMEIEPHIPLTDLHKIKCPVLVMGGDFDVIKPAHTLQIFENIPQAYLWIFPESGHGTVHRYKDEFNKKVLHFFTHPYKRPKWVDWEP
ncbi:alpha/beta fold hydrolase [Lacihabitans sp. CS3-21]|uniref:alpha/beta fold hydrolase n=1 Tax=Lacihabitans sp. CS3-21 TaxID=2487332 RepID=UPI0020CEE7EE|nr:alpha/beta hydrolase [Lacihabitans sp. CS3-21]MCP9748827.1 alpha/beta hydrolase [Lacihabitans sp. CS3-21]